MTLPSGESTLRPDDLLLLSELFFSGRVPRVDMDWDTFLWRFVFGLNKDLSFDSFLGLSEPPSPSPSLSVLTEDGTIADAESDRPSFFFPRILSLSLPMPERGLSVMERSNMLAVRLFRMNWMSRRTSPRSFSCFPFLSTSLYQLQREVNKIFIRLHDSCAPFLLRKIKDYHLFYAYLINWSLFKALLSTHMKMILIWINTKMFVVFCWNKTEIK